MVTPIRLELPTGFKFGSVNAYLFTGPEPVLVDTGLKSDVSWTALTAGLTDHGLVPADLARVIITHPHVDHCGQARRLADPNGPEIWIADLGAPWLRDLPNLMLDRAGYYETHLLPRWNFPPELEQVMLHQLRTLATICEAVPEEKTRIFQVGDTLRLGGRPWQVQHAPGHASTQTCFYQADTRQLLAADMLLPRAPAPVLEKPTAGPADDRPALVQFLESLAMLDSLEIDTVYPGHGDPFGHPRQVIQQQRARLAARQAECLAYIAAGHRTVAALMEKMYTLNPAQFQLVGLWMLVGYLAWLKWQGQITDQIEAGVATYRPVRKAG
jgi:glyoxylase-like metal-dependent hydrolase (beta-lactamase superfamily II)